MRGILLSASRSVFVLTERGSVVSLQNYCVCVLGRGVCVCKCEEEEEVVYIINVTPGNLD